jgi:hypothetical protein
VSQILRQVGLTNYFDFPSWNALALNESLTLAIVLRLPASFKTVLQAFEL